MVSLSRVLLLMILVCLTVIPVAAQETINIGPVGDTALLPYGVSFFLEANFGVDQKGISHTLRIAQARRSPTDSIIAVSVQNSPAYVDEAASVYVSYLPSHHTITQDPLFLTITDFCLFRDSAGRRDGVALGGYRGDSAFVVRNFPGTDHFEYLYLASGVDQTGNGRWESSPQHIVSMDYDYDGTTELFFYLNCGRDKWPRGLYCIDIDRMVIEWSMPMASVVTRNGVVSCRDSLNPGVLVCTYAPDNHVRDENFNDEFGYFTRIDARGKIVYNYQIGGMFEGSSILSLPGDSLYILFHPWKLPGQTAQDSATGWLSLITADSRPVRSIPLQESFLTMDLVDMDEDGRLELLTVGRSGRVSIFDLDLSLRASSAPSHLTGFVTKLRLPGREEPAYVFSSQSRLLFYSTMWDCLGVIPDDGDQIMPAAYDSTGAVSMIALSYGKGFAVGTLTQRSWSDRAVVILWRFRYWFVALLALVSLMLFVVNVRRTRALDALAKVEVRNEALLSATPDLMFRLSRDGVFLDYQASRESDLFAPSGQFLGRPVSEIFPPDLARKVLEIINQTLEEQQTQNFEYQLSVGGQTQDYEARVVASGTHEVLAIVRNITDRKWAVKALEESRERFAQVIEQSREMVWEVNAAGLYTYVSRACRSILGYAEEELVGRLHFYDLHPEKGREEFRREAFKVFDQRLPFQDLPNSVVAKDGRVLEMLTNGVPMIGPDNSLIGYRGSDQDITERKQADRALRESEKRLELFFSQSLDGFFFMMLDEPIRWDHRVDKNQVIEYAFAHQRITKVNDAMLAQYGATRDQFIGLTPNDFFAHDIEEGKRVWRDVFDKGHMHMVTNERKFDGTPVWIEGDYTCLYDDQGGITGHFGVQRDITERKRTEEALQASESKYRALFTEMSFGAALHEIICDTTGKPVDYVTLDVNSMYESLLNAKREDVIGKRASEILPRKELDRWIEIFGPIALKGGSAHYEVYSPFNRRHFEGKCYSPEPGKFVGIFTDISERKQAEEEIKRQSGLISSLLDSIPDLIFFKDLQGVYLGCNPSFVEFVGKSRDEIIGRTDYDLFDKEIADFFRGHDKRMLELGKPRRNEELITYPDGRKKLIDTLKTPYRGPDGSLIGILGISRDITERKRAEEALRESEAKFRAVAESMAAGITIFGENKLLYCNPACRQITGYSQDDLAQMNFWDIIHPSFRNTVIQDTQNLLAGKHNAQGYEVIIVRKDGEERWVDYSASAIDFLGQPAILRTTIDITDGVKAKEELQRVYNEQYRQVREIAGGVSHEIYNSLFPASTSLHKLKERLQGRTTDPEHSERDLRLITLAEQAIARAIHMTESVTQYSRLEANRAVGEVSVAETVHEIIEHNRARLDELRIDVEVAVPPTAIVACNHPHLYSLLNNLVINAMDALAEVDRRTLSITARSQQENIQIQIIDSGPGITAENQARMFTAFFSTKPRSGTGLGLAVVKKIAEMYDGSVRVVSDIDKGTCFSILMPRGIPREGETDASQSDQS